MARCRDIGDQNLSEPVFNNPTEWSTLEYLGLFLIALLFGMIGAVNRGGVNDAINEPEYWEGEDERFVDVPLQWDGHDYRPRENWNPTVYTGEPWDGRHGGNT
jgi:hypothetical protein